MTKRNVTLENIMKKYGITKGTNIKQEKLNRISKQEHITIEDLCCMLQINRTKRYLLAQGKRRYTKLKFNEYTKFEDSELIEKGKINYKEFEETRKKVNLKGYTLMRKLGITRYRYNKMKNDEQYETKIIDMEMKHTVDLITIELKYKKRFKKRYCSKKEIEEICNKKHINIDNFLKYYSKNDKHYRLNKIALEESKKGIWIGESCKMNEKFFNENYDNIYKRLHKVAYRISMMFRCPSYKEDMVQEAIIKIHDKYGDIVKKFYFNKNLLINILISKAKYVMINAYRKEYKSKAVSYDKWKEDRCEILKSEDDSLFGM